VTSLGINVAKDRYWIFWEVLVYSAILKAYIHSYGSAAGGGVRGGRRPRQPRNPAVQSDQSDQSIRSSNPAIPFSHGLINKEKAYFYC
jgi:hypothetical protein